MESVRSSRERKRSKNLVLAYFTKQGYRSNLQQCSIFNVQDFSRDTELFISRPGSCSVKT